MNMNELATSLGITNGALTSHIKKLEESGIIQVMTERGSHGNQKVCKVAVDKIVVDVESEENEEDQNIYNTEVKVGHLFGLRCLSDLWTCHKSGDCW